MRRKSHKNHGKAGNGKVVTGLLLGSVLGATVGLADGTHLRPRNAPPTHGWPDERAGKSEDRRWEYREPGA